MRERMRQNTEHRKQDTGENRTMEFSISSAFYVLRSTF